MRATVKVTMTLDASEQDRFLSDFHCSFLLEGREGKRVARERSARRTRSSILPVPILLSTAGILVRWATFENEDLPRRTRPNSSSSLARFASSAVLRVFTFVGSR